MACERGRGDPKVVVRPNRLAMMVAATFAMASVAVTAHAAPSDLFSQHDDFTPQPNQIGPQLPHKTLQWNDKVHRWGFNVDMAQPGDRDVQWRDARVGLNYGVAPGVRTGVGVSLGEEQTPDGRKLTPDGPAPRVRLETTFKF
jgi:hypothetical protein